MTISNEVVTQTERKVVELVADVKVVEEKCGWFQREVREVKEEKIKFVEKLAIVERQVTVQEEKVAEQAAELIEVYEQQD